VLSLTNFARYSAFWVEGFCVLRSRLLERFPCQDFFYIARFMDCFPVLIHSSSKREVHGSLHMRQSVGETGSSGTRGLYHNGQTKVGQATYPSLRWWLGSVAANRSMPYRDDPLV
jgi:hypothetical protein